jgi:putative ABC transport system substrate-binding protein
MIQVKLISIRAASSHRRAATPVNKKFVAQVAGLSNKEPRQRGFIVGNKADRPDDPAECVGESGQGDQMTEFRDRVSGVRFQHKAGAKAGFNAERYPALAAELVGLKVDIIVADTTGTALAAKKATTTIPIVMTTSSDPVGDGLIASMARPGGNVTGLTNIAGELGGKVLELLKEVIPALSRVVAPHPAGGVSQDLFFKETEISARALGVKLIRVPIRGPQDFDELFRTASKERADALLNRLPPTTPSARRKRFVDLAAKSRLPAIYFEGMWVDAGGLMSYGPDRLAMDRRAAVYVDKILKGTKPADLPVEQPIKFELIINLKAAKQIGLTIPPNVMVRADRVIR